jgi:hypothetical protein
MSNWCVGTKCRMYFVCSLNVGGGKESTYQHPVCPVWEKHKETLKEKTT